MSFAVKNPKTSFFQPKRLVFITISTILAYILLWSAFLVVNKIDNNRRVRSIVANQDQIKNLTPEEQSIKKAQNYLTNSINTVDTSERIFLSYLQRKFDLPSSIGADGPPIDLYEDPRTYPAEVHYLARIAYPDRIVKEVPRYELDDGVKVTNIYSANCDHLVLPADYWDVMERNIATGGYYAAHVILAFSLMKDNNCTLTPNADIIKGRAIEVLVGVANDPTTVADLRYEAIAFLLLGERKDLIKAEWINQIISEQRSEGGWSRVVGESKNDPHATLLALWALLEYARPNTPDEPLILRPSGI